MRPADRPLPQSLEAEQATLGAMLTERAALVEGSGLLDAADFYTSQHQLLFQILQAHGDGPADIVTVKAALGPDRLAEAGGENYLLTLQAAAPTAAMLPHYAAIVKGKARDRAALLAALNYSEAARRGDEDEAAARAALTSALADLAAGAAPALESYEVRDFLARDLPAPAEVVEGLLREGTVSFLYGPPEGGKSMTGADLCRSVANGRKFLGRFPCLRGPAVLVEEESSPALLRERLALLEEGDPSDPDPEAFTILPLQGFRLNDPRSQEALRALLRGLRPKLLVVDTLAAVAGGADLLKVEQVRPLIAFLRGLAAELAAAVLLLAHCPKWQGRAPTLAALYGSEDLGAACDSAFALCRLPVPGHIFRLAQTKNRWGGGAADFTFTVGPGERGGLVLTATSPEREPVAAIILDALDGGDWVPNRELKAAVLAAGYTEQASRKALVKLQKGGKVAAQGATSTRAFRLAEEAES